MNRPKKNGAIAKSPLERRLGTIDYVLNIVRFAGRKSPDIEERDEAIEIERLLSNRRRLLENGQAG